MKRFVALLQMGRGTLLVGTFCVSLGLAGCSGQLGKIEVATVDMAMEDAAAAITAAEAVDAPVLVSELFAAAEANLGAAREALEAKQGAEALRLAYQALADAAQAAAEANHIARNAELNASILQKDGEAESLREKVESKKEELTELRSEVADIRDEESQLREQVELLVEKNRELGDTRAAYGEQVAELSETLGEIQGRSQRAEREVKKFGREIAELRRKLEVATRMAKEEGHQKRAVIAEINSLRRQLKEQAEVYTEKLAAAGQKNAGQKHAEFLKQKAAESRAYVASQAPLRPTKTGRVALSAEQIAAGKTALGNWDRAWHAKNLNAHLAYYDPTIVADKVVMRESKEHRSKLDRQQLESDLSVLNGHTWNRAKSDVEVEGESVIGVQRLTRLAVPAADENATAMYNIWIREVWMHQVGEDWKVHHEIWQIYENVPNF